MQSDDVDSVENYRADKYTHNSGNSARADEEASRDAIESMEMQDLHFEVKMMQLRKKRRRKKILVGVIGVIVVLLAGVGVAAGLYVNSINNAMSMGDEDSKIKDLMVTADINQPFYMLLVGSDWRENSGVTNVASMTGDRQRADVIVLARIDLPDGKITMLSIPRDTAYLRDDGTYCKLNELYDEGRGVALVPAVEALTGARIAHYAEVYFSDFEQLIDSLGGIELDIPADLDGTDALTDEKISIKKGHQLLNGAQALMYARERKTYEGNQDQVRQGNIRTIMQAMMKRIQELPISDLAGVLKSVASCVRTDLTFGDVLLLANNFRTGVTMYSGSGPSAGDVDEAAGGLWLCYEDPEGWQRVMAVVDAGEDPGDVSYEGDVCTIAGTDTKVIIKDDQGAAEIIVEDYSDQSYYEEVPAEEGYAYEQ